MIGNFAIRAQVVDNISGRLLKVGSGLKEESFRILEELADAVFDWSRAHYLSGNPIWSREGTLSEGFRRERTKTGLRLSNIAVQAGMLETGKTFTGATRIYAKDKPLFVPLLPEAYQPDRPPSGLVYGEDYFLAQSVGITKKPFFQPAIDDVMSQRADAIINTRMKAFIGGTRIS